MSEGSRDAAERIIARIERDAGAEGLVELLADRIAPTDLHSLLLAVRVRQGKRLTAPMVLRQYERDRFVAPGPSAPGAVAAFELEAFGLLAAAGYTGVELSPVSPLGTINVLGGVHQNRVVATDRNTEVVADSTNSLALEAALRRRAKLRADPQDGSWVRLCASHRLLRAQQFDAPNAFPHFRLLALITAGRDQGSYRFETASLVAQLNALLSMVEQAIGEGLVAGPARVAITDLTGGQRRGLWRDSVIAPLRERHPDSTVDFDDARDRRGDYYVDCCFKLYGRSRAGHEFELGDGGFTTWTRALLSNAKERLLTGCLAVDRLLGRPFAVRV